MADALNMGAHPPAVQVGDVLPYYGRREVAGVEPVDDVSTRISWKDAGKEGRGDASTTYWNGITLVIEREQSEA